MSSDHTFFENVRQKSLLEPGTVLTNLTTGSVATTVAGATGISLMVANAESFSVSDSLRFQLEDSDDDVSFDAVTNGGNSGLDINVIWADQTDNLLLTESTLPRTLENGAEIEIDTDLPGDHLFIAEYKGTRAFVRMRVFRTGAPTLRSCIISGQVRLAKDPNIIDIGDNN